MINDFIEKFKNSTSVTIAFLGDSVTQGFFEIGHTDYESAYHNLLKKQINVVFPKKVVNIINAGIGGQCAKDGFERVDKDVISHNPDLTVVCFGLNDINGDIEEYLFYLDKIFEKLKNANILTIFMTPNMLNTAVTSDTLKDYALKNANYQNNGQMDSYIESAIQLAKKRDVFICNCYEKWKKLYCAGADVNALLANCINHPIDKMHYLFAQSLFDLIFF